MRWRKALSPSCRTSIRVLVLLTLFMGSFSIGISQNTLYWLPQGNPPFSAWDDPGSWSTDPGTYTNPTNLLPQSADRVVFTSNSTVDCRVNVTPVVVDRFEVNGFTGVVETIPNSRLDVRNYFSANFGGTGRYIAAHSHTFRLWKGTNPTFLVSKGSFEANPISTVKLGPLAGTCSVAMGDPFWRLVIQPTGPANFILESDWAVHGDLVLRGNAYPIDLQQHVGASSRVEAYNHLVNLNRFTGVNPSTAKIVMTGPNGSVNNHRIKATSIAPGEGVLGRLEINKTKEGINLDGNLTVSGEMMLTTGHLYVDAGADEFRLLAGSFVTGGSCRSFVDGPVKKFGNTDFEFPIGADWGSSEDYAPVQLIELTDAPPTAAFEAQYFDNGNPGITNAAYPIANREATVNEIDDCRYWEVNELTGATYSARVGFWYDMPGCLSSNNPPVVLRHTGTTWSSEGSQVGQFTGTYGACTPGARRFARTEPPLNHLGPFALGYEGCALADLESVQYAGTTCPLGGPSANCQGTGQMGEIVFNSNDESDATQIFAYAVPGADEYEFAFFQPGTNDVVVSHRQASRRFTPWSVACADLDFDTDYDLKVRIWVNGSPCPWSNAYPVTTQKATATWLKNPYCDFYVPEDNTEIMPAFPLRCAESYNINVVDQADSSNYTTIRSFHPHLLLYRLARTFRLGFGQHLRVRFQANYPNESGPWGKWCDILTPLEHNFELDHPDCSPNSNNTTGGLSLQINGGFPPLSYTLIDENGSVPLSFPPPEFVLDSDPDWDHRLDISGLSAGSTYKIEVTDQVGNKVVKSFALGIESDQYPDGPQFPTAYE
ncbi:MAG: hypothetical protein AAF570_10730, partial [Bacteroidota bacterium]